MTNTDHNRRVYAITVFLILIVCYAYFMPKWGDWNANSRADLVYAVVDNGVLHIDDYHENTGDKACYPGPYDIESDTCQGHYYTDKSIGPSLVALPFYAAFRLVAQTPPVQNFINSGNMPGNFAETLNPDGRGTLAESVYQGMALTVMTFFAISLPSALPRHRYFPVRLALHQQTLPRVYPGAGLGVGNDRLCVQQYAGATSTVGLRCIYRFLPVVARHL